MNILWLSNYPLPKISEAMNEKSIVNEGWKITIAEQLSSAHELTIAFPYSKIARTLKGEVERIKYIAFPCEKSLSRRMKHISEECMEIRNILKEKSYDIIHIWGTEFPHSYATLKATHDLEIESKAIVSIQGIAKECFVHYLSGVDYKYIKKQCLTDILRGKSIYLDAINMETRGILEDQTFELAVNCIGRTDFDRRYVQLVNPSINYYSCNETLRNCFYDGSWNLDKCVKHSIIMSQGGYPLKGLHNVLKALPIIKKRYPDVVLYLAGGIVIQDEKSMSILKRMVANHAYSQFLNELVKKGGLENSIVQLGSLSAEKMKEAYLKANVYLLASSIENSPNSLGEAMLLGVPAVVSNVGGVRSMCDDNIEVLMYQHDDYYMLASRIIELFQDEELQLNLSKKSKIRAINSHDSDKNYCKLTEIYSKLCEKDISLKEQKKVMKGRT